MMRRRSGNKQIGNLPNNGACASRWRCTVYMLCFFVILFFVYFSREVRLGHIIIEVKLESSRPMKYECLSRNKTPKVALMFLAVNRIHNEPAWRAFFEAAGRICLLHQPHISDSQQNLKDTSLTTQGTQTPMLERHLSNDRGLQLECLDENLMIEKEADRLMSRDWNDTDLIDRQTLFTVYVNSLVYDSPDEPSIFTDQVIEDPINTHSGFSTALPVTAAIKMMAAALKDPTNERFVLLSEACVPVHPPEVIHAQLISESKSRITACEENTRDVDRWKPEIVDEASWRKSSQFFTFTRSHAQLAVDDTDLISKFSRFCFTTLTMLDVCVPDEHYFPTLIADHGLENETDCVGYVTSTEWPWWSPWHPLTYEKQDVNPALLKKIANSAKDDLDICDVDQASASTSMLYGGFTFSCFRQDLRPNARIESSSSEHWMLKSGFHPLSYACPLIARKFPEDAVRETLEATLSCTATGLGHWCY